MSLPDGEIVIEAHGLAKRFGQVQAVDGIDFEVRQGEVFGFLGTGVDGHVLHQDRLGLRGAAVRLPGVIALSILFGTTSMLAVTVTFEKKGRSFERLLLAPVPLEALMLAKTSGAIVIGVANSFVPFLLASPFVDLGGVAWWQVALAIGLIAISSTFMGLFIAVSVSEVFEAQTFSNFFRLPMVFLCGLFFPIALLPAFLRPLSYAFPLTYGADLLHGATNGTGRLPVGLDLAALAGFCIALFLFSLRNVRRKWIG